LPLRSLPPGIASLQYLLALRCSGGIERSVLLWQPKGNVSRAVGELSGHSAGVQQLVVADDQSQVSELHGWSARHRQLASRFKRHGGCRHRKQTHYIGDRCTPLACWQPT
jgi:hypothetical protein